MEIELDRVLARLEESDGVGNVVLDGELALAVLGGLAIVDPERIDRYPLPRAVSAGG